MRSRRQSRSARRMFVQQPVLLQQTDGGGVT